MTHPLDKCPSIPLAFFARAVTEPDGEVYTQAVIGPQDIGDAKRGSRTVNHREAGSHVEHLAGYLQSLGIAKGDRAAIISNTRPEWMEADIAVMAAGGVSVSVYHSLTAQEVGYILFDSEAKFVFVENDEQLAKILELLERGCEIPAAEDRPARRAEFKLNKIIAFEKVASHPLVVDLDEVRRARAPFSTAALKSLSRDELAAIVYSSGTSGPPKGVLQTHGNHLSNVRQVLESGLVGQRMAIMLFLPLAHSFAKLMGYIGFLAEPTICFPAICSRSSSRQEMDSVTRDIRESKADIVPVVPRILEKMRAALIARARGGDMGARLLGLTIRNAAQVLAMGGKPGVWTGIIHGGLAGIRAKIKASLFGDNFKYAISGGAKLDPAVNSFFESLDIVVLEGYGLTETCVATNVNRVGQKKIGTVGKVLSPDIEIRIQDDGEISFRGPNVSIGYLNRPAANKEAWDADGWFHTGDLGSLDAEGYLSIIGRKKEIIVTSYGKKITPESVEVALKSSPYISQAVLFGDDKPYCAALLTLNREAVRGWAEAAGLALGDELNLDPKVNELIEREVAGVNSNLASFESVRKFFIAPEELSIENGLLTPTLKIKRQAVLAAFREQISALFEAA